MPRWIFAAAGIALFALFIVLILWPSGERRAFFADHEGLCVGVSGGQCRHNGLVDDPQAGDTVHA